MKLWSTLIDQIKSTQRGYSQVVKRINEVRSAKIEIFQLDFEGVLWYQNWLCVPKAQELRKLILEEAHHSTYISILELPRCNKTLNNCIGGKGWRMM